MNQKIIPPRIHVYYIERAQPVLFWQKRALRRLFLPGLLILSLLIGISGGTFIGWTSRFGQAQRQDQLSSTIVPTPVQQQSIPLQFNQSDLTVVANLLPILIEQNRHIPTVEDLAATQRKDALVEYLVQQKSPLAKDDDAINALLHASNMKMILAISFVESNMCKKQVGYNCSGIGGSPLKKYANFAAWVEDFDKLLGSRYKDLSVEQFIGYYVQPGSQNWIDGVYQILGDLSQRHID